MTTQDTPPLSDEELTAFEAEAAHWPKSNALAVGTLLLAADLRELRTASGRLMETAGGIGGPWSDQARVTVRLGDLRRLAARLPTRGDK